MKTPPGRRRRSIDDTLRLTLLAQRKAITTLCARLDQAHETILVLEARIADLEDAVLEPHSVRRRL